MGHEVGAKGLDEQKTFDGYDFTGLFLGLSLSPPEIIPGDLPTKVIWHKGPVRAQRAWKVI